MGSADRPSGPSVVATGSDSLCPRVAIVVTAASQAVQAARRLGYPVALTAIDPENERRVDGVGVRLDLYNDRAVRGAWRALSARRETQDLLRAVLQDQQTGHDPQNALEARGPTRKRR